VSRADPAFRALAWICVLELISSDYTKSRFLLFYLLFCFARWKSVMLEPWPRRKALQTMSWANCFRQSYTQLPASE
jgi:hypothetical protein